jgi:hypothetical protein
MQQPVSHRLKQDCGIAIGPILFVVAILAILATAIAAGSSTFATNASQETNRTNAAALVQIGQSLKTGVDRIVALGTPVANVDINASNTSSNTALFSPLGGGLIPPSTTLAATPASDAWVYTYANWAGLGSNTEERLALLRVTTGVCNQINTQVGVVYTLAGVDYGAFDNTTNLTTTNLPAAFNGKMTGCIQNSNGSATGTYLYQILAVQ